MQFMVNKDYYYYRHAVHCTCKIYNYCWWSWRKHDVVNDVTVCIKTWLRMSVYTKLRQ